VLTHAADVLDAEFDACVVGAGPAGLACALELASRGVRVLLLEAGGERPTPGTPDLLAADIAHPQFHDPVDKISAAALGGSSHWWGGRSLQFDYADFSDWPVAYSEMLPWYDRAAHFLGVEAAHEEPAPGSFAKLTAFDATRHETWPADVSLTKRLNGPLRAPRGPAVVLGARVTGVMHEADRITGLRVRVGKTERVARAKRFVLACGGLGSLKLLLLAQRDAPHLFGGPDGPLGRGYMGHLAGAVADLELANANDREAFSGRVLRNGVRARRRIRPRTKTISEDGLVNIAFWVEDARNEDPSHGSSIASAKYVARVLAKRRNTPVDAHLSNIARAPASALVGLGKAALRRAAARVTGQRPKRELTLPTGENSWRLAYHAEQKPHDENRVSLSPTLKDSVGAPALHIDFRFREDDTAAVLRAHDMLDADLRAAGAGQLRMRGTREECLEGISASARDGYHQLGGAIMHNDAKQGVVDSSCRAHGLANLFVISGSVFPSGGQANPTLTIVALALRLAEHLAATI
jgi:choline dehydrogenase-like flavoprotein